ncbi:hypothetical protein EYF80_024955 [Liparis tanakae]|uniref:Uncharacterized protein n=1 Tax=Liparis tanakae TaxID=230148 RepID=A0A4Z2HIV3_9TELE|nr:hypothetical protein EYF80_024955 [Liparis tanakae]
MLISHSCEISNNLSPWLKDINDTLNYNNSRRTHRITHTSSQKSQLYCTFIVNYSGKSHFHYERSLPWSEKVMQNVNRPFTPINVPLRQLESRAPRPRHSPHTHTPCGNESVLVSLVLYTRQ